MDLLDDTDMDANANANPDANANANAPDHPPKETTVTFQWTNAIGVAKGLQPVRQTTPVSNGYMYLQNSANSMVCDIVHSMFEDFMESVYCIMVKVFDDNKIKPRLRKQIDYYLTYDAQKCPSSDDART